MISQSGAEFSSLAPQVSFCAPLKFPSIYPHGGQQHREPSHSRRERISNNLLGFLAALIFSFSSTHAGGLSTWSEVNSEVHPPDSPLMEINPHSSSPFAFNYTHTPSAYIQSHLRSSAHIYETTKLFRHEMRCYHVV
jgi:hypothetical protein